MSKFNGLLKMSAFFLSAQKRKEINVSSPKKTNHWTDPDDGEFRGDTFISPDETKSHSNKEYDKRWRNEPPTDERIEEEIFEENRFPKSPYQDAVESLGDQKPDYNAVDKMVKSAKKAVTICSNHLSKDRLSLAMLYTELKNKYKITGSSSIDRIFSLYKKYTGTKREIIKELWSVSNDLNIQIITAIKAMDFVKNFFEDFKILFEILKFEDVSMELPAEKKWPIREEFDFESGGKDLVTPKEDLQDMLSFVRDEIQKTLEELHEQIQIFDENKIEETNW